MVGWVCKPFLVLSLSLSLTIELSNSLIKIINDFNIQNIFIVLSMQIFLIKKYLKIFRHYCESFYLSVALHQNGVEFCQLIICEFKFNLSTA